MGFGNKFACFAFCLFWLKLGNMVKVSSQSTCCFWIFKDDSVHVFGVLLRFVGCVLGLFSLFVLGVVAVILVVAILVLVDSLAG